MTELGPTTRPGCLLGLLFLAACQSDVSLGHWARTVPSITPTTSSELEAGMVSPSADAGEVTTNAPSSNAPSSDVTSTAAQTSTTSEAGVDSPAPEDAAAPTFQGPACLDGLGVGQLSAVNAAIRVTETSTDWSLPEPSSDLEWTLMIERDVPVVPPDGSPTVGYYWHNQFSFIPGVAGRFGFQTQGVYQAVLTDDPEFTKIVVFWLSGPPLAAELGDIPFPDARVAETPAGGLNWQTIHARFDWQECHVYRFRVGVESTDADNNMWYGAWITDTTTNQRTFLGRMLLPSDTGLLSTFSSSRTSPIVFPTDSCQDLHTVSAIFGAPTSQSQIAAQVANHFTQPVGCARSIIGEYENSVRHELAVH